MKFIKPILVFLFFALVATLLLSLLLPTRQKLERSIGIKAPAAQVYAYLSQLKNFTAWSVWSRSDSSARYTPGGTDGTVGATSSWTGDPDLSGKGRIEITGLQPGVKVEHAIRFTQPAKRQARSVFTLQPRGELTTVTWNFEIATPRPWNIFNLFYSLDKETGAAFESSLAALKKILEEQAGTASGMSFDVYTMNFPATRFAAIRQTVQWNDIASFFGQHLPILFEETVKAGIPAGTASGLYYSWDEKNRQSDLAAAVPVPQGQRIDNPIVSLVDIPASKAVYVNYSGTYDHLADAYTSIRNYCAANNLSPKYPSIEQYISGPFNEKDSSKWFTKIVFLVQ